jgi:transglutaminase-like putative cysteine protease
MTKRDFPTLLLYAFGFLLIWEWLRPVEQLTDTDNIEAFIIFLILAFAVSYLRLKWFWQWLINAFYILFSINRFYYSDGFFQPEWMSSFLSDMTENLGLIFARSWNDLTDEFRTILFFVLLWLMVYLLHYWLLRQQRIFIFFFMTLVYITVLDTFTEYDAKVAIVRTVIVGFAVMGMLTYYRISMREHASQSSPLKKWMVPLVGMIAFSVLLGIAAPKAAPIWPDPVPYLTAANNKGGSGGVGNISRIGYGSNDEQLGGPFIGDNTTVYTIESNGKHYWKVETKDVYTGKGWIASGSTPIDFIQSDLVPVFSIPSNVETRDETARVTSLVESSLIVYPAGVQKFIEINPGIPERQPIRIDTTTEKIRNLSANDYTVAFEVPRYKAIDLRKPTGFDPTVMNQEFYQRYTEIPDNLPARVKQLTEEITAGEANWFDKAKAVESYFGNTEYTYDQKNVALPGEEDDYVDQFLFDTKTGYCDNFSTSMAVMLRTIGIPTRWVKGFTGGEFMDYTDGDESKEIYQITNNNAHSWVEVFIPGQGWVPFEPTKGFSNELSIDYTSGEPPASSQTPTPAPAPKPEQKDLDEAPTKSTGTAFDLTTIWKNIKDFFNNNWLSVVLGFVGIATVVWILYRIRGKWFPYILMFRYRFKRKDETIGIAYLILLKQLERYGLKRQENQTLRSYARYIDSFFSTREMTRLTNSYEQYVYHKSLPEGSWNDTRKLWENLIKKTIA